MVQLVQSQEVILKIQTKIRLNKIISYYFIILICTPSTDKCPEIIHVIVIHYKGTFPSVLRLVD